MPIFNNVQFRTYDYDGFKESLFEYARSLFPQWTDVLESNSGVMMVEWLSFIGSSLAYTQNFYARQGFVPTVTEAKNLSKLAKQYDYTIPSNAPASTEITLSLDDGGNFAFDAIIPQGSQFQTSGTSPLIWETVEDLLIGAGSSEGTVGVVQQETQTESDTADGTADYSTALSYGPYINSTMEVTVGGGSWSEVDTFLDSSGVSEHFRVESDSDGIPTVIFGDGVLGAIPTNGADLEYSYAVGGGTDGNVPPSTIITVPTTFYDVNGNSLDLVVTNSTAGSGGLDREAIDVTKLRLPASIASKEITLDYEDFENNILSVPGVARVSVLTVNDNPAIPENTVYCYILPGSGEVLTEGLESLITTTMEENYPRPLTQGMFLIGPQIETVEIDIRAMEYEPEDDDGTGVFASATITVTNNTFDAGDSITVNGVEFVSGVDWFVGVDEADSADLLAAAIEGSANALLQDITASSDSGVITVVARTTGVHGNTYTLEETDGATDNFTISGATFENGEDSTVQADVRTAIDTFFGRQNVDEENKYTVGFGQTVYRTELIKIIKTVDGVLDFNLFTPAVNTDLATGVFPTYNLVFTSA